MDLTKNSSAEEILQYIDKAPFYFLYYFSDKHWAQPYIDEAVKIVVKKSPLSLLYYFLDKPWTQLYIGEAVKIAAKKYPELFLEEFADRFPQGINLALFALGDKNESV